MTIIENLVDSAINFLNKSGATEATKAYKTKKYNKKENWFFSAYQGDRCIVEPVKAHKATVQQGAMGFPSTQIDFEGRPPEDLNNFLNSFYDPNLPLVRRGNQHDVKLTCVNEFGDHKREITLPACFPRSINFGLPDTLYETVLQVDLIHNPPIFEDL